jgi:diaminohydroxyphosphoribosylaminopyrimidine deaminase/5-amino-6-(5-phosphoribosylamino)uracil reductase
MDADLADEICISRGDVEIGDGGLRPFVDRDLSLVADLGRHELGFAFPAGRDTMMRYVRKRS